MTLTTFLAAVRRYWKEFIAVCGVVFVLGLIWILLTPAKYVSTVQLLVSIQGSTTAAAYQNDQVVAGRINSYIPLLSSGVVTQRVIDKLGLSMTAPKLAAEISSTNVPPKTSIIDVAVTDESPQRARLIADTVAQEFISYAEALETPTGEDSQKVRTTVVTAASEPREQGFPHAALGVLAALAGLLAGAVAVWVRSGTDPVVRTPDRAAAAGVPVVGCVTSAPMLTVDELEGYRRLRTRVRSTTTTGGGCVWVLTSADGEVDVAGVASNLGRAMELAGASSIVLDGGIPPAGVAGDKPQPIAGGDREADNETGSDGPGDASAELPIRRGADGFPDTLAVVAWAHEPDSAATQVAAGIFERLRKEYAHVIVAAPPVLMTITASVVSQSADGVLLMVSLGKTRRRDLGRAADELRATGAPPTGAVLCEAKPVADIICSDTDRKQSETADTTQALASER